MNKVKLTVMIDAQKVRIPNSERTIRLVIEETDGRFVVYNTIDIPVSKHNLASMYNDLKDLAMQGLFAIQDEKSYNKLAKKIETIIERYGDYDPFAISQIYATLCIRSSTNFKLKNVDTENIIVPRSRDVLCI